MGASKASTKDARRQPLCPSQLLFNLKKGLDFWEPPRPPQMMPAASCHSLLSYRSISKKAWTLGSLQCLYKWCSPPAAMSISATVQFKKRLGLSGASKASTNDARRQLPFLTQLPFNLKKSLDFWEPPRPLQMMPAASCHAHLSYRSISKKTWTFGSLQGLHEWCPPPAAMPVLCWQSCPCSPRKCRKRLRPAATPAKQTLLPICPWAPGFTRQPFLPPFFTPCHCRPSRPQLHQTLPSKQLLPNFCYRSTLGNFWCLTTLAGCADQLRHGAVKLHCRDAAVGGGAGPRRGQAAGAAAARVVCRWLLGHKLRCAPVTVGCCHWPALPPLAQPQCRSSCSCSCWRWW